MLRRLPSLFSAPAFCRSRWEPKLAGSCIWIRPPSLTEAAWTPLHRASAFVPWSSRGTEAWFCDRLSMASQSPDPRCLRVLQTETGQLWSARELHLSTPSCLPFATSAQSSSSTRLNHSFSETFPHRNLAESRLHVKLQKWTYMNPALRSRLAKEKRTRCVTLKLRQANQGINRSNVEAEGKTQQCSRHKPWPEISGSPSHFSVKHHECVLFPSSRLSVFYKSALAA